MQDLFEQGHVRAAGVAGGAVDGDHAVGGEVADEDPGDAEGEVDPGGQLGHRQGLVAGQGRDFRVVGEQIDPSPYGIGVRKDDADLQAVLQEALRAVIEDGSYDRVLTKWNVTDGALKTAKVTGAP